MRPPAAKPVEVVSGSLEVLNIRCGQISSNEIAPIKEWKFVTAAYAKADPGCPDTGKKTIKFTQHCEITLALAMLKRHLDSGVTGFGKKKLEIGVSKTCCGWCWDYLSLLNESYSKSPILVRVSHGKKPDGWMVPPSGPKSITKQMVQLIEERVDNVIWAIHSHRQSDSNCNKTVM